jgi:hypothetical protein
MSGQRRFLFAESDAIHPMATRVAANHFAGESVDYLQVVAAGVANFNTGDLMNRRRYRNAVRGFC